MLSLSKIPESPEILQFLTKFFPVLFLKVTLPVTEKFKCLERTTLSRNKLHLFRVLVKCKISGYVYVFMFLLLSDTYLVGWDWVVLEQSMMFLLAITLKRVPAREAGRGCAQVPRHLVLLFYQYCPF